MAKRARIRTTKKDVLIADDGRVLTNLQIMELFGKAMNPVMPLGVVYPEILVRVGDTHKPITLDINIYGDSSVGGSVYPIQIPPFSREVLDKIENYRIIDHDKGRGIYRVLKKMSKEPGTYVLTNEREPIFKIGVSQTPWVVGRMTFEHFGDVGVFKYFADLDSRPRKITMKTSVVQRANNPGETLIRKLFLDFHTKLKRKHRDSGMTLGK